MPVITSWTATTTWNWTTSTTATVHLETWGQWVPVASNLWYSVFPQANGNLSPPATPPRVHREPSGAKERAEERRRAQQRAEELLLSLLSLEERRRYRTENRFRVIGSAGGEYWISAASYQGNVRRGRQRLCAHPSMRQDVGRELPGADALVAQLLMLRFDEPAFLQIANVEEVV